PRNGRLLPPEGGPGQRGQRSPASGLRPRLVRAVRGGCEGGGAADLRGGVARRRESVRRAARPGVRARRRRRGRRAPRGRLSLPRSPAHDPDGFAGGFPERRGGHGAPALLPFPAEGAGGLKPPRTRRGTTIFFWRFPVPFIRRTPPRGRRRASRPNGARRRR